MVPINPYPNIVVSLESKILGFTIPMSQFEPRVPLWMFRSAQNRNKSRRNCRWSKARTSI